jgi:hypothetical protein
MADPMPASVSAVPRHYAAWTWLSGSAGWTIFGMGVCLALLLAVPGETVATRLLEDLFAILDGVHRLAWGQVPARDFHSGLGPLAYYIPGFGYAVTGNFGAALPLGMGALTVLIGAVLAIILPSRLSPALSLPFGFFLLVILVVPMNLGDAVTALTFNQYYNRIGWVSLAALLVLFLPTTDGAEENLILDAACAAALTLLMIYTRASYGLVAVAFLLFMLTDRRQWRWAAIALTIVLACGLLVELVWRGSLVYAQDVLLAFDAGGYVRGTPLQWLDLFLGNLADFLLLGLLTGLLLWRRLSVRELFFVLFCAVAGFWLLNQNDQRWGMIAVHGCAVVLAERLLREMRSGERPIGTVVNPPGVQLYFFAFLFPTMVHCTIALMLHAGAAVVDGGRAVPLARLENVRLVDLWTPGDFGGSTWFLDLITDGFRTLDSLDQSPGRIVVLGAPNPFSLSLDLPPAAGDVAQMRWGATHSQVHHISPAEMLGSADLVMERVAAGGIGDLGAVYLPYVEGSFEQVAGTANWRVFARSRQQGE